VPGGVLLVLSLAPHQGCPGSNRSCPSGYSWFCSWHPEERWEPNRSCPWVPGLCPWHSAKSAGDKAVGARRYVRLCHRCPEECWGPGLSHPVGVRGSAVLPVERWGPLPLHLLQCSGIVPWHPEERRGPVPLHLLQCSGIVPWHPEERFGSNLSYPPG
jgi:hypothetical protein